MADRVVIGRVVGTFGLKGFLKVWPETDFPERFEPGNSLFIGESSYEVVELQWHKKQARIRVKGVRRLAEAEPLIGMDVSVPSEDLPELEEGEYMVGDLIGLEVFDESGKLLDEAFVSRADKFLNELVWMAKTLRYGRENIALES